MPAGPRLLVQWCRRRWSWRWRCKAVLPFATDMYTFPRVTDRAGRASKHVGQRQRPDLLCAGPTAGGITGAMSWPAAAASPEGGGGTSVPAGSCPQACSS